MDLYSFSADFIIELFTADTSLPYFDIEIMYHWVSELSVVAESFCINAAVSSALSVADLYEIIPSMTFEISSFVYVPAAFTATDKDIITAHTSKAVILFSIY